MTERRLQWKPKSFDYFFHFFFFGLAVRGSVLTVGFAHPPNDPPAHGEHHPNPAVPLAESGMVGGPWGGQTSRCGRFLEHFFQRGVTGRTMERRHTPCSSSVVLLHLLNGDAVGPPAGTHNRSDFPIGHDACSLNRPHGDNAPLRRGAIRGIPVWFTS